MSASVHETLVPQKSIMSVSAHETQVQSELQPYFISSHLGFDHVADQAILETWERLKRINFPGRCSKPICSPGWSIWQNPNYRGCCHYRKKALCNVEVSKFRV